jgi:glycopeptide antibiotics resistance protein
MKRLIKNLITVAPFAICLQTFLDGSPYWIKLALGTLLGAIYLLVIDLLDDKDNAN